MILPLPGVGYLNSMFVVVMDSWTYDLNDGWVCYLFAVEHAGHGEDWDDIGYGYEALIGRPGGIAGGSTSAGLNFFVRETWSAS